MNMKFLSAAALAATLVIGVSACERKGAMEQAGEEVDEAIDSMKRGGESAATKLDDAVDEVRDGVNDAVDEIKN